MPKLISRSQFSERAIILESRKITTRRVWLFALLLHVLIYITVGLLTDYFHGGESYISIRHPAELTNGFSVWVIFVPMVWAYYYWFPKVTIQSMREWENDEIIHTTADDNGINTNLSVRLTSYIFSNWLFIFASVATVITYFLFRLFFIPNQNIATGGVVDFWYKYQLPLTIFLLLLIVTSFIFFVLTFRVLVTVYTISRFFYEDDRLNKLYPMHPDGSGGLGKIGLITVRLGLIAVLTALWATIFGLFPWLAGGKPQWQSLLIIYAVYLCIVPVILYFPLWSPHIAMQKYKKALLIKISKELQHIETQDLIDLQSNNFGSLEENLGKGKKLIEMIKTFDESIPVWPISTSMLRNFSVTASSPLVVGFISFASDRILSQLYKSP